MLVVVRLSPYVLVYQQILHFVSGIFVGMDTSVKYRIGIDVGTHGIGLAAIECDDVGIPIDKLAVLTQRIDSGMLTGSESSPKSRKAVAGQQRRVKKARKQRRRRLKELDELLVRLGYPIAEGPGKDYEIWHTRARLVEQVYTDREELKRDVSAALRHIARHRGWRNAWLSWEGFTATETPTALHQKNLEAYHEHFGTVLDPETTVGQLAAAASAHGNSVAIRSRGEKPAQRQETKKNSPHTLTGYAVFGHPLRQADHLAEMRRYWEVQPLLEEADFDALLRAVLHQLPVGGFSERVGFDALPGMGKHRRVSKADLVFQQFRIRAMVANLMITGQGRLSAEQHDAVVDLLMNWHLDHEDPPGWDDITDHLGISRRALRKPGVDDAIGSTPAVNKTLMSLYKALTKTQRRIVDGVYDDEREALYQWLGDSSLSSEDLPDVFVTNQKLMEKLTSVSTESGRAAYSRESLELLNEHMAAHRSDLHTARKAVFDVDDSWTPPLPSIEEPTGQPAVDQNLAVIRKFVMGCVERWGRPEAVNIEHVRSAFMGPVAIAKHERQQRINSAVRQNATAEFKARYGFDPKRSELRRYEQLSLQSHQCAYCGTDIDVETSQLDHVVPRAGGGNSSQANLLAVCVPCNTSKSRTVFAVWAQHRPGVDLNDVIARVESWYPLEGTQKKLPKYKQQMLDETCKRLRQTEQDEPVDERSMESTAYAARSVGDRLKHFFGDAELVRVYRGSVVSAARHMPELRGQVHLRGRDVKDRNDFRHHAIDACVIAMMTPASGQALAVRERMRSELLFAGITDWEDRWLQRCNTAAVGDFRTSLQRLGEIIAEMIEEDTIPVVNPLRLSRKVGEHHKAGVFALESVSVEDELSAADLVRVVDWDLYLRLKHQGRLKGAPGQLPASLIDELKAEGIQRISLFPKAHTKAIPVNNGCCDLSGIHHVRIYEYLAKGKPQRAIMTIPKGEIARMWPDHRVDVLTAKPPEASISYRNTSKKELRDALDADTAKQVGWLAPGVEIEFTGELPQKLAPWGERRWMIAGFETSGRVNLRPLYLAKDGLRLLEFGEKSGGVQFSAMDAVPWRFIQRNALGQPRHTP